MHVLTVVGARPQFVKASVVTPLLTVRAGVRHTLVHTGQHYDWSLSGHFFEELELPPPDVDLGVGSGPHGAQTGAMLARLEQVLVELRPDVVLVYGDTNSTLAGALAAVKLHLPVAHVEAGLRSYDRRMPEEINRRLTDHAADLLFAPTEGARRTLIGEGIDARRIEMTGDVMYDAALRFRQRAETRAEATGHRFDAPHLQELDLTSHDYLLATVHRAENTDDPARLRAIMEALVETSRRLPVVLPLHPRTAEALERSGLHELAGDASRHLHTVPPVGYLDMTRLEARARIVATDSGGVQKEAFFHRVPCVTLRDTTEWVELVDAGWNRLADPAGGRDALVAELTAALADTPPPEPDAPLYGDGRAAERICKRLLQTAP